MASIGSYYVRIMPDMNSFGRSLVSGLSGASVARAGNRAGGTVGRAFGNTFLGFVQRIAIGTTIGRLVTNGFNAVVNGISTGVERLDIIENYPHIMANMGIANEDAEESVNRLQEALLGLPTSLQDGVTATQRLTATLGDVDRGTDAFIAFNNALVAGMAPVELQATALEQFSQAVAKGKPDMIEWRSMMQAMPAQMNQIAMSFGLTSDELGEALRHGDISMDEFLDHIIQLNEEGVDGFASFADQAHTATNTIGTALTNVGNRIAAGWADILGVFGQENIANSINAFSVSLRDAFGGIADALQWLVDTIGSTTIGSSIETIATSIADLLAPLGGDALIVIQDFVTGGLQLLSDILQGVADHMPEITSVFETFGEIVGGAFEVLGSVDFSPITDFVNGTGEAFAGMMERIQGHLADLQPFLDNIGTLWRAFTNAVAGLVETVAPLAVEFFAQLVSGIVGLAPIIMQIASGFLMFASMFINAVNMVIGVVFPFIAELVSAIVGFVSVIATTVEAFASNLVSIVTTLIGNIIAFFARLPQNLSNIWSNIVNGAKTMWNNLKTAVTNTVSSVVSAVTSRFESLRSTIANVWGGIKTAITTPINVARDAVKSAIDKIRGFFNVTLSFPHIKLPHFRIDGGEVPWGIGGMGHAPSIRIDWYAQGGIVDGARLIGVGERGPELIWPTYEPYLSKYAAAIVGEMESGGGTVNNYYIDGNLVAADAVLASALDVVAQRINGRTRMGTVR